MAVHSGQYILTLEQIEQSQWGPPPADATWLIRVAREPRRKPINALTPEDLRLMIRQRIGVETLVPIALTLLAQDPLIEGDFYPGDLLVAVMSLPIDYWAARSSQATALRVIAGSVQDADDFLIEKINDFLAKAGYLGFLAGRLDEATADRYSCSPAIVGYLPGDHGLMPPQHAEDEPVRMAGCDIPGDDLALRQRQRHPKHTRLSGSRG